MGFKFRCEALLSYRSHIKEKAEVALSREQKRLLADRDLLESCNRSLRQAKLSLEKGTKSKMSSDELRSHSDYIFGLGERIIAQEQKVAESEKAVKEKIADLLAKTRDYKAIEKLKEKDFQKWKLDQNRAEQKWMDEVGVTRYGRDFS